MSVPLSGKNFPSALGRIESDAGLVNKIHAIVTIYYRTRTITASYFSADTGS